MAKNNGPWFYGCPMPQVESIASYLKRGNTSDYMQKVLFDLGNRSDSEVTISIATYILIDIGLGKTMEKIIKEYNLSEDQVDRIKETLGTNLL